MKYLINGLASMVFTGVALASAHGHTPPRQNAAHAGHPLGIWQHRDHRLH